MNESLQSEKSGYTHHFDEKKIGGTTLSRQNQGVRSLDTNFFSFLNIFSRHFEKYLHTLKLKLTEHILIIIFLLHKQKT